MIPLTNYDFQWGRSEVVIIYPDLWPKNIKKLQRINPYITPQWSHAGGFKPSET